MTQRTNAKKMIHAGVFFNNNHPNGFGFMLNQNVYPNFDKHLEDGMQEVEEYYARATKKQRNEMFREMKQNVKAYIPKKLTASINESMAVFVEVWFLEKHNKIASDEFNGCTFAYDTL